MLEWATLIMATIAAIGSVVRVAQNQRAHNLALKIYKLHRKAHKKRKK
jgi:hypothetical protein